VSAILVVAPTRRASEASRLARSAGLEADIFPGTVSLPAALTAGAAGRSIFFVRDGARVPRRIRSVVVLHEGSPAASGGIEAGDRVALVTGAQIVILHNPKLEPADEPGALPTPRVADEPYYEWQEWQVEFLRRFCRCSEGVSVRLEVVTGSPAACTLERARHLGADLIVLTWKGEAGSGHAETLKAVAADAPCPLLILREARRAEALANTSSAHPTNSGFGSVALQGPYD